MFNMLSFSVYPKTFLCEMYLFKENIEFCRRYFYIYLEFVPKSNQCHSRRNYTYFVNFRVMNCLGNWSQEQRLGNNKEESILRLLIWEYKVLSTNRLFLSKNTWWRHQMVTFSALLTICAGNSPVPGEFPHKGQWRGALMFSLICVWINGWVNNRKAGDLRGYRIHYDVIVMIW